MPTVPPYAEPLRVIVIDDSEAVHERVIGILRGLETERQAEFAITQAATYEDARDALISEYFDLAIVDLVLHSGAPGEIEEWEGFWLLQDLSELDLQEETAVVVLTNFNVAEAVTFALTSFKAFSFVSKDQSSEDIAGELAQLLERKNDLGMRCDVTLEEPVTWRELVLRLGRGQFGRLTSPVSADEAQVELNHLVRRLEQSATHVHLTPLEPGHSGAAVARVTRYRNDTHLSDVLIKYGLAGSIHEEQRRYAEVSDLVKNHKLTHLNQMALGRHLGVLEYTLLGADPGEVRPFHEFYQDASASDLRACLRSLFASTCERWYSNRSPVSAFSLESHYEACLGFSRQTLAREYAFKFGSISGREEFRRVELPRVLPDPVTALLAGSLAAVCDTWMCPSHGDLHGGNLLIDGASGDPWLIDFAAAGTAHWARDFAALECCIKFQYTDAHDLGTLYEFESALTDSALFGLTQRRRPGFDRADVAKALQTVMDLRQIMVTLVGETMSPDEIYNEYHAALLFHTLNYLRFHSLLKKHKARKYHVLTAAAIACEIVSLNGEGA